MGSYNDPYITIKNAFGVLDDNTVMTVSGIISNAMKKEVSKLSRNLNNFGVGISEIIIDLGK